MKVLVLGGDGFCGWPTSLHLSAQGYEVAIVDNLSRRKIDVELECESLTPILPMGKRLEVWEELTGNRIDFHNINVAENYRQLLDLLLEWQPDAVIHFAEQRAAPYSMKSSYHKRYTVNNNLNATNNLLAAITESGLDTHVVHLGTMGVYGYGTAGMQIPEGYLTVKVETDGGEIVEQEILYPPNPGRIYHMTKTQDQLLFAYYNKNDLTTLVSDRTGAEIDYVPNPRNEAAENDLHVRNDRFLDLGLEPTTLSDGLLGEVTEIASKYAHRCDLSKIPSTSLWRPREESVPQQEGRR